MSDPKEMGLRVSHTVIWSLEPDSGNKRGFLVHESDTGQAAGLTVLGQSLSQSQAGFQLSVN